VSLREASGGLEVLVDLARLTLRFCEFLGLVSGFLTNSILKVPERQAVREAMRLMGEQALFRSRLDQIIDRV
jgi:hypothetical protein